MKLYSGILIGSTMRYLVFCATLIFIFINPLVSQAGGSPSEYLAFEIEEDISRLNYLSALDKTKEGLAEYSHNTQDSAIFRFYAGLVNQLLAEASSEEREKRRYQELAFDHYVFCRNIFPDDQGIINNLARLYSDMGLSEQALSTYKQNDVLLDSLSPWFTLNLSKQYMIADSVDEANLYFYESVKKAHSAPEIISELFRLSFIYKQYNFASSLRRLMENDEQNLAFDISSKALLSDNIDITLKPELLVIWIESATRLNIFTDLQTHKILSENMRPAFDSDEISYGINELRILFSTLDTLASSYSWWLEGTKRFDTLYSSFVPSKTFDKLIRELAEWHMFFGRLELAEKAYRLVLNLPDNDTDAEVVVAIADILTMQSSWDELAMLIEATTPAIMGAKSMAYRNWNPKEAYRYHVALGSILTQYEQSLDSFGDGVISAEYQLRNALELGESLISDSQFYDSSDTKDQSIIISARTVTDLAAILDQKEEYSEALSLRLKWTEFFLKQNDSKSADRVFETITKRDNVMKPSNQEFTRYRELLFSRPWDDNSTGIDNFKLQIYGISIQDNKRSSKFVNPLGLFGKDKANIILFNLFTVEDTKLLGLDKLGKVADRYIRMEIVGDMINDIFSTRVCRNLNSVTDNNEIVYGSSLGVVLSTRHVPTEVTWTCLAVSPRNNDTLRIVSAREFESLHTFDVLVRTLVKVARHSDDPEKEALETINKLISKLLLEYTRVNNDEVVGLIQKKISRVKYFPDGYMKPVEFFDGNKKKNNLRVLIGSPEEILERSISQRSKN